jgi:hypothetical protein
MNLDPILDETAEIFRVPKMALIGAGRARRLALPRFAFYRAVRDTLGLSLPAIGRAMGGRDHTSVIHGLRRADEFLKRDPDFAQRFISLQEAVQAFHDEQTFAAEEAKSSRLKRVRRHMLHSLERLAIENPKGFDKLMLQAGSHDATHHL